MRKFLMLPLARSVIWKLRVSQYKLTMNSFYKFYSQFNVFEQDRDVSLSRDKLIMIKLIHSGLFKGGFTARALCWTTDLPLLQ